MPLITALALSTAPSPTMGQSPAPNGRPWLASVSHWGKWAGLAGSAGFLTTSALRHRDADRLRDELDARCGAPGSCGETAGGQYLDESAESQRQESLRLRRQARAWLVAGEVSLLATGTMFLLDLIYGDDGPQNIPYTPFSVYAAPGTIGVSARF